MHTAALRALGALLTLVILVAQVGFAAPPATALATLASDPPSLTAVVPLGQAAQLQLTLRNSGDLPFTPQLFEARAAPPGLQVDADPPAHLARVPLPRQAERVDPQLLADLAADGDGQAAFLIFLADQADLTPAYRVRDWGERGWAVYRILTDHAARSQAPLRAFLSARGLRHTPLWVVNALLVEGDAADVAALAARPEVALLQADQPIPMDEGAPPAAAPVGDQWASCSADPANRCWNVVRVGADRVWDEFGVRGQGITVASIDSGVTYTHPALVDQYRGNLGGGSFDHRYNWFDPYGNRPEPTDGHGGFHGTHTMGTMVAGGGAGPVTPAVGMAPEARWIAAMGCDTSCLSANLILAAQWLLAPTDPSGAHPRPDLRPHIINNSWASAAGNNRWYAGYTAAWRAAGIFPVFAAGNKGDLTRCGTAASPGDYADVLAVGATNQADQIAAYSSVGPTADGRLKPDLTAPGSGILSTIGNLAAPYGTNNGTSMAAPHIAGAVALLWSANPSLIGDYDETYRILTSTADPITDQVRYSGATQAACSPQAAPNNVYGHGVLNIYSAVAEARVDVPWLALPAGSLATIGPEDTLPMSLTLDARMVPGPGTYTARVLVHSADLTQAPLEVPVTLTVPADPAYATVSGALTRAADGLAITGVVRVQGGAQVATDRQGRYTLTLPPTAAPYTLTASALDYAPESLTIQLAPGAQAALDFALEPDQPQLLLEEPLQSVGLAFGRQRDLALPLRNLNSGTHPISYTLELPAEPYGVWRGDQPDGPLAGWIDPPPDATALALSDDGVSPALPIGFPLPFAGQLYERLQVLANGVISLTPISSGSIMLVEGCLPIPETPGAALAPLRVDLDPTAGGRVSYASIAEGMLISWEDVPLYGAPDRRLSFQALLRPDGRVRLNYRQVGALQISDGASAGLQASALTPQSLGCRDTLDLGDGLAIELRPQPSTALWMELPSAQGSIAPGAEVSPIVRLRWVAPPPAGALSGSILVRSNDPLRPLQRITVRLNAEQAPYTQYFPFTPRGP